MPVKQKESRSAEQLERMLSVFSGGYTARGVAVDDEAFNLISSIEEYSEVIEVPIKFRHLSTADDLEELYEHILEADFLLVDYRLRGRFEGVADGLELVKFVRSKNSRIPIFLFSAYPQDFHEPVGELGEPDRRLNSHARGILTPPWSYFFSKEDMVPQRRLLEFVQMAYWESAGYLLQAHHSSSTAEIVNILRSTVDNVEVKNYRVLSRLGRGWTQVQDLDENEYSDSEVPSRLLRKAGVRSLGDIAQHRIVEFSKGQVLSYFKRIPGGKLGISELVRDLLDD